MTKYGSIDGLERLIHKRPAAQQGFACVKIKVSFYGINQCLSPTVIQYAYLYYTEKSTDSDEKVSLENLGTPIGAPIGLAFGYQLFHD